MSGTPRLSLNIDTSDMVTRPTTPDGQMSGDGGRGHRRQETITSAGPATPVNYAEYASPLGRTNDPQYMRGSSAAPPMSASSSVTTIADLPERQPLTGADGKVVKGHHRARSSVHFDPALYDSPLESPSRGSMQEITVAQNQHARGSMSNLPFLGKRNDRVRNSQIHLPHDAPGPPIQATYIGEKRQYGALGRKYRILRYVQSALALLTFALLIATIVDVSPFTYTVFFFEWFYVIVSVVQLWLYYLPFCVLWNRYVAGTAAEAVPDRKTGRGKIRHQVPHDDWCMLIFDFCASGSGIIAIYAAVCRSVRCAITSPGIWDFITDDEFDTLRGYYQKHGDVCPTWHVTLIFEVLLAIVCIISFFTTLRRITVAKKQARRLSVSSTTTAISGDLEKQQVVLPVAQPVPTPAAAPRAQATPAAVAPASAAAPPRSTSASPRLQPYQQPREQQQQRQQRQKSRLVLAKDRMLPRHISS